MVRVEWYGEEVKEKLANSISEAFESAATEIEIAAQTECPVDTGNLQESIRHETTNEGEEHSAQVGTDVEYGLYVELGTKKMAAQPFLRPALYDDTWMSNFESLL